MTETKKSEYALRRSQERVVRSAMSPPTKVGISFPESGRTKQSFREECDINNIMARYQSTGLIDHYSKHSPSYGFADGPTFHEAQLVITKANSMFEELPSSARKYFENDPAKFLDFVDNLDDNDGMETMRELGLANAASFPATSQVDEPPGPEKPEDGGQKEAKPIDPT